MKTQDIGTRPRNNAFFVNLALTEQVPADERRAQFSLFCLYYGAIIDSLRQRYGDSAIYSAVGLSRHAWDLLYPHTIPPKELETFTAIEGDTYSAPSTAGDIFLHLRADTADICYEALKQCMHFLAPISHGIYEIHGFSYLDGRAIIGFVDGTANPHGEDVAACVTIGDEDPDFAGGSYLFTQKYLHAMQAWDDLSVEEQEKTIGRRKFDDLELLPEEKYTNAHNVISQAHDENGDELEILRANVIFSNPSQDEYGTFFISYSRHFSIVEQMLENMFKGNEHGAHDKLLEYSQALTGTLFFVPSVDLLGRMSRGELD